MSFGTAIRIDEPPHDAQLPERRVPAARPPFFRTPESLNPDRCGQPAAALPLGTNEFGPSKRIDQLPRPPRYNGPLPRRPRDGRPAASDSRRLGSSTAPRSVCSRNTTSLERLTPGRAPARDRHDVIVLKPSTAATHIHRHRSPTRPVSLRSPRSRCASKVSRAAPPTGHNPVSNDAIGLEPPPTRNQLLHERPAPAASEPPFCKQRRLRSFRSRARGAGRRWLALARVARVAPPLRRSDLDKPSAASA
jgi:hypothetical protein